MHFEEYEEKAIRTANNNQSRELRLANGALGLAGEAGEVADIIKKHISHGHELDISALRLELGDVLCYIAFLCHELGLSLSDVAQANNEKLLARYPNGFSTHDSINRTKD